MREGTQREPKGPDRPARRAGADRRPLSRYPDGRQRGGATPALRSTARSPAARRPRRDLATPPGPRAATSSAPRRSYRVPSTTGAAVTATPPTTVTPEALVPGPGLPARGQRLEARRRGRPSDRQAAAPSTTAWCGARSRALSEPGVAVFVAQAGEVARYSRITQGVGVNRVPALVVVRPKRLSGGDPAGDGELRLPRLAERRAGGAGRALLGQGQPPLQPGLGPAVTPRELPDYLRPVPGPGGGPRAPAIRARGRRCRGRQRGAPPAPRGGEARG